MENQRLFTFLLLSVATVWLWGAIVAPRLFPQPEKPAAQELVGETGTEPIDAPAEAAEISAQPPADTPQQSPEAAAVNTVEVNPAEVNPADPAATLPAHPPVAVTLGSLDPESGYGLQVGLTSAGAAVEEIQLTDPQFRDLQDRGNQVRVVGNNTGLDRTFTTAVNLIDDQLVRHDGRSLESEHWKLDQETDTPEGMSAAFSYDAPDGRLRVEKVYRLLRFRQPADQRQAAFRTEPVGYTVECEIRLINLAADVQDVTYELQGPVGVLLENQEHTSKFRDIKIEFLSGSSDVTLSSRQVADKRSEYEEEAGRSLSRAELFAKQRENDKWTGVFRYAGIDVQFFAALVAPLDDRSPEERLAGKWIDRTYPVLISEDRRDASRSDISFRMVSTPLVLQPKGDSDTVVHRYALYTGPKRRGLLDPLPLAAARVLDYGTWFGFVARGMHWLLDLFYGWGMPYVLAIISLTALVRGCLFPLSRKQAISAAKMKDLQPLLTELKTKYGDDREKLARAQMELWRKNQINPLAGCLPLFIQMPIFIGLYTSLNTAVDLRLARFLWIDNLAAPDALFRVPFDLPFLGRDISLLPCLTVGLFLIQQKLFMPPAMDEQQEAQHKMMNMMTVFFGFMFWHQPAGLCLYFIASSLWGIAERLLLARTSGTQPTASEADAMKDESATQVISAKPSPPRDRNVAPAATGMLRKLMDLATDARENAEKTHPRDARGKRKKRTR